jgi:2-dehydropantoate 2-reductase
VERKVIMEIKTVSIIGLGALGMGFGELLLRNMPKENLRIVADEARIKRYKEQGIYVNGKPCDFNYITPEETGKPADLLIFMVKSNQLQNAIKDARNQVGKNTIIMSALNGITSEEIIGEAYGMENIFRPSKTIRIPIVP